LENISSEQICKKKMQYLDISQVLFNFIQFYFFFWQTILSFSTSIVGNWMKLMSMTSLGFIQIPHSHALYIHVFVFLV